MKATPAQTVELRAENDARWKQCRTDAVEPRSETSLWTTVATAPFHSTDNVVGMLCNITLLAPNTFSPNNGNDYGNGHRQVRENA